MNVERVRAKLLEEAGACLAAVENVAQLDELWVQTRQTLAARRRHLGRGFDLLLASRFDQRAQELRARRRSSL
jgi:hypothetical protein